MLAPHNGHLTATNSFNVQLLWLCQRNLSAALKSKYTKAVISLLAVTFIKIITIIYVQTGKLGNFQHSIPLAIAWYKCCVLIEQFWVLITLRQENTWGITIKQWSEDIFQPFALSGGLCGRYIISICYKLMRDDRSHGWWVSAVTQPSPQPRHLLPSTPTFNKCF